jgi:acyl-CoA synthetase (AMP-forming)/AMP-acid ligase II
VEPNWFARAVAAYRSSDRPAVIDGERRLTGSELLAAAATAAEWIDSLGLPTGAPLPALVTTNTETVVLLLAGASTRHPLAPLGPRLTASELAAPVAGLASPVLLHEPDFAPLAAELHRAAGVRTLRVPHLPPSGDPSGLVVPDPDDVGVHLHTSGTTGTPKRVPMTQRVLLRRSELLAGLVGLTSPENVYATGSPFHHIGGMGNLLVAMSAGATVVTGRSFSIEWWRSLAPLRVTHALLVPSMIEMLLDAGALDAVPLRTLIYGASPIRPETLSRVLSVLPGVDLVNLFGQTEGSPITCLTPEDHRCAAADSPELLHSVGRPVPGLELRLDDPDASGAGELHVRGPHLFAPDADGWLRTGDIGSQDADGYVYLAGRAHDRIVRGGENVYPAEVERVIEEHPAIARAGAVGVPDPRLGETIAAFVVAEDGARVPAEAELRAHVRARLAGFKVPAYWYAVPELPHSAAGKLLRRELRDWHTGRAK